MSHYDVEYDPDKPEDHERAIADVKAYATDKQFDAMVQYAQSNSLEDFQNAVGLLVGIQGFPIRAFYIKYGAENG